MVKRGDPRRVRDDCHVAFGIGICPLDCRRKTIRSDPPGLYIVGLQHRGYRLRIDFGIDVDDFDLLGGSIDRFAKRGKLRGRDHNRGWVRSNSALEQTDLTVDIGFGLGAELDNVGAKILAGFTRARQHDAPVQRGCVLDDDRNRWSGLRQGGRRLGLPKQVRRL